MPAGEKQELFAAWRTFFERLADRNPVIMVFGDLHWADMGLMDFIEHLLTWAKSHPILVIALARPELLERRAGWGTAVRSATTVTLEPLPSDTMRELLHGLVPGLPDDAATAIAHRSEGVPLYAVETVRMLLDTGQLRAEGDVYVLDGPLTDLQVPASLRALVAARLDANDPADRALLTDAAVLGQSFTLAGLEGMTGRRADELQPALDRLIHRELLLRDDDPRSPERGQYRFLQAVVREVAYESLAKKDRRAKHLAVARHMESLGDDELAGVLASHYVEAYRAAPEGPEADALAVQARIALRAAADRAAALHSHASAVQYLEEAVTVTSDAGEQAALYERAAESSASLNSDDAVALAARAIELYRSDGDEDGVLRATVLSARSGLMIGRGSESIAALEGVLAVTPRDAPGWAAAMGELARAYMLTGRRDESVTTADQALAAIGDRRMPRLTADILVTRGTALQARPDEAVAILRGAVALADVSGDTRTMIRARNNLLTVLSGDITLDELAVLCRETADLARRGGDARFLAQMLLSLADAARDACDWPVCDAALADVGAMELDTFRGTWYLLSSAFRQAFIGDQSRAEAELAQAEELSRGVDTHASATKLAFMAEVHVALGDVEKALEYGLAAVSRPDYEATVPLIAITTVGVANPAKAREIQTVTDAAPPTRLMEAARHQLAALVAVSDRRWDDARAGFRAALAGYEPLGHVFYGSLAALQFEAYLGARFPDARQAGTDAAAVLAQGGGSGFVERYRAAMAQAIGPSDEPPAAAQAVPVDAEQPA